MWYNRCGLAVFYAVAMEPRLEFAAKYCNWGGMIGHGRPNRLTEGASVYGYTSVYFFNRKDIHMKFFRFVFLCILSLAMIGCTSLPSQNSQTDVSSEDSRSAADSSTTTESNSSEESVSSGESISTESSAADSSQQASSAEDAEPETLPEESGFTWVLRPSIEAQSVLPIRDGDTPGSFNISPSICFVEEGLVGLMNQTGRILLPAEYADICYSRTAGGLIALREGSTTYQRLDNQYQPSFEVDYSQTSFVAATSYVWDPDTESILDTANDMAPYEDTSYIVVRQSEDSNLYALGNANGLSTDFIYSDFGPTGLINEFFVQDEAGWHLVNHLGEDLLDGMILRPRLQRTIHLEGDSFSSSYVETAPYPCSEGVFTFQGENGKWGFYDASGNMLVDFIFEEACPVSLGNAWVKWNGMWGLITVDMVSAVG